MQLGEPQLTFIKNLVYKKSAIVLEGDKTYLIEARLGPLARAEGFPSIEAMVERMRAAPTDVLHSKVVEAMTTNETTFFRDQHPFDALRDDIIPTLRKSRQTQRTLNVWSAACSSGQEAHSIGMLLREKFPDMNAWQVKILGTDLCNAALTRARNAKYMQIEVNRGLPAPLLLKYFTRDGADWQLKDDIRKMVEYKWMNLIEPWPRLPTFDIIFLRNVLIYFDVPTKKAILGHIKRVLAPDGYLFLGGAETTLRIDDDFERIQCGKSVFYRPARG
jgi:chemotaxis protein methyltransferase CheR